ncbi:MAG: hypothetical protein CMO98_08845 [Woeseia sp.]|nr:hypothetical protein [Woeseia sp.]
MQYRLRNLIMGILASFLWGCAGIQSPLATVSYVDLERFMGDWYVIASIPTFVEKGAHNAVEKYALNADGSIQTTFIFRKNSFDGERKEHNPTGYVLNTETNAEWGMQFIWPIKADYRIVYLADDYSKTIIGRNDRDYVWIMARTPVIQEEQYAALRQMVDDMGYDLSKLLKVPQQW